MKPSELSKSLRHIAAKIDASKRPDRTLVSRDLKRVLVAMTQTAARSDVLNQVNAAFMGQNVYQPSMVEISKNVYSGDIDTGWTLKVEELKDGSLKIELNGIPVNSLKESAVAFKKKDPKYLLKSTKPIPKPDFENKDTYCLWGFGEPSGKTERIFSVSVFDLPNGSHKVHTKLISGKPAIGGEYGNMNIGDEIMGTLNSDWSHGKDVKDGFFNYLLTNANHPDVDIISLFI